MSIPWARVIRSAAWVLPLLALAVHADAQQTEDTGVWLGGFVNGKLPPSMNNDQGSWRLWTDVQLRFGDDASEFAQAVLRPGIGYSLKRGWSIWGGYGYIRTDPPYSSSTTNEHRIWEQAIWSGAIGQTGLQSRTRLEQRFVSSGNDVGWRVRELVKLSRPVGSATMRKAWSVIVSDEYFVNVNSTDYGAAAGSDRNRFFVGPGLAVSRPLVVEIGYLNQYTIRASGPNKTDHLFATNLLWRF